MCDYNENVNDYLEQIIEDLDDCTDEKVIEKICKSVKKIRELLGVDDYTDYDYYDDEYDCDNCNSDECDGCEYESELHRLHEDDEKDEKEELDPLPHYKEEDEDCYDDCDELMVREDGRVQIPVKILDEIGVYEGSPVYAVFDESEETISLFEFYDDAVDYVESHANSYIKEYNGKTVRITVKNFFNKDVVHCEVYPNEGYAVLF